MKAAVFYHPGEAPKYDDFADPVPANNDQLLITMKAAAIKNLDRGIASGQHYTSSDHSQPRTLGVDGVGVLADGTKVYGFGVTGMIAEKAVVDKNRIVKLPEGIDDATAAALPNAVMGAGAALKYRAALQPGEVVLINGATGVTGMIAVQLARHYGASKVIVTGRNQESLNELLGLGADEAISLTQDDDHIIGRIKGIHNATPIDVVIDYLWGHPAELILSSLQGRGGFTNHIRYITIGGMAGDKIQLSSGTLRSSNIELLGSGIGSLSADNVKKMMTDMIPEVMQLAADGKITVYTVTASLKDVEAAWNMKVPSAKRLVILME